MNRSHFIQLQAVKLKQILKTGKRVGANMKLKIVLEPHMDLVLVDFGRDNISLTPLLCLPSKNYDKMNLKLQ